MRSDSKSLNNKKNLIILKIKSILLAKNETFRFL